MKKDIEQIFLEFEDYFINSKYSLGARLNGEKYKSVNYSIKNAYQIGIKFEASPAWRLFRARAKRNDRLLKFIEACKMLMSGLYSCREVQRKIGWSKNTVCLLLKKLNALREKMMLKEICCPCGMAISIHRGWCKYRFQKSDKRKQVIKNLHVRRLQKMA